MQLLVTTQQTVMDPDDPLRDYMLRVRFDIIFLFDCLVL